MSENQPEAAWREAIAKRLETWAAVRDRSSEWRDGMEEAAAMVREEPTP